MNSPERQIMDDPYKQARNGVAEIIFNLSGGDPGAVRVLTEIVKYYNGLMMENPSTQTAKKYGELCADSLSYLTHNDITGPFIWLAYKDVCNERIITLVNKIEDKSIAEELEALPYGGYKRAT